jgi:hypothetical protein
MLDFINEIISYFSEFFRDEVSFWVLQSLIVGMLLYAIFRSMQESYRNKNRGIYLSIKRGKKSIGYFYCFSTFFTTAILAIVFSITDVAQGYKISIFLMNVVIVLYLSYLNNWLRNKLVGLFGMIQNKKEE